MRLKMFLLSFAATSGYYSDIAGIIRSIGIFYE